VSDDDSLVTLRRTVAGIPGLTLLVLFGSRARGDNQPSSDWDFGYVASRGFDPDRLLAALVDALNSDRVDLVDLRRAGAQLRYRAARDGRVVAETANGEFARFWFDAVSFWCDVQPLLRRGYDAVLAELGP
jgi:predicted nucleotidyltransferase